MKNCFLTIILSFLFISTYGQDWYSGIKRNFYEEDYGKVLALCAEDSIFHSKEESTDHHFARKKISTIARECLMLSERAQDLRKSNPQKAKELFERIRKIRTDNWRGISDKITIKHPKTDLWIEEIGSTRKKSIEVTANPYGKNISAIIFSNTCSIQSKINDSYFAGDDRINTTSAFTTASFDEEVMSLWENSRFYFTIEHNQIQKTPLIRLSNKGWSLINIPIVFAGGEKSKLNIEFTSDGKASAIKEVLPDLNYLKNETDAIVDSSHYKTIRSFVEKFRKAYVEKDIDFIEQAFSEYAIVIVGKDNGIHIETNKEIPIPSMQKKRYSFLQYSKNEYIGKLKDAFEKNKGKHMNILFSDVEVLRHHEYEYLYGVTLKQMWYSSHYNDIGWVFLLIKFSESNEKPIIFVRTWQPLEWGKENVFGFNDFMFH